MWSVYIVQCSDGSLYTGIAKNVAERFKKHNEQKGAKYTATRTPVTLMWSAQYENRSEALKQEHAIKQLTREQKLHLIAQ